MDPQLIKSLIDALASSSLSSLAYSHGGHTLRLAQRDTALPEGSAAPVPLAAASRGDAAALDDAALLRAAPAVDAGSSRTSASTAMAAASTAAAVDAAAPATSVCASPLYGVVHLQATPGDPPFVAVGDAVRAGQTLCVIEAMKVFNEVQAERTGVVQAVLVQTGDEVEAGQALFRVA